MIAIDSRRNHVALDRWRSVGAEHLEAARRVMQSVTAPPLLGVVSTLPGEGRTQLVRALADVVLRDYRQPALVVDFDLHNPALTETAGATGAIGVRDLLRGVVSPPEAIHAIDDSLSFLPLGREGVVSDQWTAVEAARTGFFNRLRAAAPGAILVDLPPLGVSTYARTIAAAIPELVLVVAAGEATAVQIREATSGLSGMRGAVLNRATSSLPGWLRKLRIGDGAL